MKLSLVTVAGLVAAAAATPHPECEPCAAISDVDKNALDATNKYLCCDLTCATAPTAGCGIFGLPIVCKACYNDAGIPAYDDPPVGGDTTPSMPTEMPAEPMPTEMPAEPMPTEMPAESDMSMSYDYGDEGAESDMSMSYGFDDPMSGGGDGYSSDACTACDMAPYTLTETDWAIMTQDSLMLTCDMACMTDPTMAGCGAFGLPVECRAVPSDTPATSDPVWDSYTPSSAPTGAPTGVIAADVMPSPSGLGCSSAEEAMCADITPAQMDALASYDNGGKIIVCDPTCSNGGDPSHCNYFGLGQNCRGCGSCESCTPCP